MKLMVLRYEEKLTLKDLSQKLELTLNGVGEWEKGRIMPTEDNLKKIAKFFKMNISDLMGHNNQAGGGLMGTYIIVSDVKFIADYQTEFEVVVPPSTGEKGNINSVFEVNATIDPTSDPEFNLYIDKILSISITEVKGEVLSISKNLLLETAVISISNENHYANWEFTNKDIEVGTILTLDNDSGQWNEIENILLDKKILTISVGGQTNDDDFELVVLFDFSAEVIANPLD